MYVPRPKGVAPVGGGWSPGLGGEHIELGGSPWG